MKAKRELMELDEVLTPKEAAAALKVRVTTLSNWRVAGRGPQFTRVGRSVRYAKTISPPIWRREPGTTHQRLWISPWALQSPNSGRAWQAVAVALTSQDEGGCFVCLPLPY